MGDAADIDGINFEYKYSVYAQRIGINAHRVSKYRAKI